MGSCTSRTQVLLTEKSRDTVENLDEETERFEAAPVLTPVRVFRDGQVKCPNAYLCTVLRVTFVRLSQDEILS